MWRSYTSLFVNVLYLNNYMINILNRIYMNLAFCKNVKKIVFWISKEIKFQKYWNFFSKFDIFTCYLLHDKWHLYCTVGLRSCPLVVRFMRFISGRCSVHLRCIRSVSVSRTVSSESMRFSSVGVRYSSVLSPFCPFHVR